MINSPSLRGEVVVASGNAGKLAELRRLLADLPITLRLQSEFAVVQPEETGLTFVENALIKARAACEQTGLPAIADDSGLEVDSLHGAPGVRSARFAEDKGQAFPGQGPDSANRSCLREAMAGVDDHERRARFHCVLAFLRHAQDPVPIIAQGSWEGTILRQEQGDGGFGYDPLFWVPSHGMSAAELEPEVKNAISHRAMAVQQFQRLLADR